MEIRFYVTKDENNRVDKILLNEKIVDGSLRDEFNVLNPVVSFVFNPNEYNYCYIPSMQRYYFVDSVVCVRKGYYMIKLSCDVLMTYSYGIKEMSAIVEKQETNNNPYIDKDYTVETKEVIEKYSFENNFDEEGQYILITTRGSDING